MIKKNNTNTSDSTNTVRSLDAAALEQVSGGGGYTFAVQKKKDDLDAGQIQKLG